MSGTLDRCAVVRLCSLRENCGAPQLRAVGRYPVCILTVKPNPRRQGEVEGTNGIKKNIKGERTMPRAHVRHFMTKLRVHRPTGVTYSTVAEPGGNFMVGEAVPIIKVRRD
jgi:hypothetical protein